MNKDLVMQKMQEIFDNMFLDPFVLKEETSASEIDEWDSLMQITIVVAVEQAFKIRFKIGEVESTKNIGQFADLILKRLNDK